MRTRFSQCCCRFKMEKEVVRFSRMSERFIVEKSLSQSFLEKQFVLHTSIVHVDHNPPPSSSYSPASLLLLLVGSTSFTQRIFSRLTMIQVEASYDSTFLWHCHFTKKMSNGEDGN